MHARRKDAGEEAPQVHAQDDIAVHVRFGVGAAGLAAPESVGRTMDRHGVEDATKDPPRDRAQARLRRLQQAQAVALRDPFVTVVAQRAVGRVRASRVGEPLELRISRQIPQAAIEERPGRALLCPGPVRPDVARHRIELELGADRLGNAEIDGVERRQVGIRSEAGASGGGVRGRSDRLVQAAT